MNYTRYFISLLLLASGLSVQAQEKRAMTFDEMVGWERISEQRISDNGKWVFCKMEPWRGDAAIRLYNGKGEEKATFKPASTAQFSASSEYLLVTKVPPLEMVEAEKRKKTGKDKMPMNNLVIFRLTGGEETVDSLKTYKLSETADWLAYQRFRICPKRECIVFRIRFGLIHLYAEERKQPDIRGKRSIQKDRIR